MAFSINDNIISGFITNPRYRIYRHLLLLLLIFFITINMFWDEPDTFIATRGRFYSWLAYFSIIIVMVYVNILVLVPRFLLKNRFFPYILSVFLLVIVAIGIFAVSDGLLQEEGQAPELFVEAKEEPQGLLQIFVAVFSSVLGMFLLVGGTSVVLLFQYWIIHNQRIGELEAANLESELEFLKNQINPHFLFNMLNNANVLIRKNPVQASGVLFKLEDFLRYQINDSSQETVLLSADIRFLNDFLNLEKVRRDKFEYSITEEGDIDGVRVPPLLFIPFVENAVKHNFDSENVAYVHLSFNVSGGSVVFTCVNSKPALVMQKNDVGGIGLNNIKRRLALLYPGRHTLEIIDEQRNFTVNLKLEL